MKENIGSVLKNFLLSETSDQDATEGVSFLFLLLHINGSEPSYAQKRENLFCIHEIFNLSLHGPFILIQRQMQPISAW